MLNKSGVTKTTMTAPTQILANVELQSSVGCVVAKSAGITVGDKTIVKAGTPVTGSLSALTTAFTAAATAEATEGTLVVPSGGGTVVLPTPASSDVTGIILHDVDVTNGAANATLLLFGFVNKNRIDSTTKAKITSDVEAALSGKITFLTV